jgi:hypothetical protein
MRAIILNIHPKHRIHLHEHLTQDLVNTKSFRAQCRQIFYDMLAIKLPQNARQIFQLHWIYEAVDMAYKKINIFQHVTVEKPSKAVIARILERFAALQHEKVATNDEDNDDDDDEEVECEHSASGAAPSHSNNAGLACIHSPDHLQVIFSSTYRQTSYIYKQIYIQRDNRKSRHTCVCDVS